jgi:hypothetical protein
LLPSLSSFLSSHPACLSACLPPPSTPRSLLSLSPPPLLCPPPLPLFTCPSSYLCFLSPIPPPPLSPFAPACPFLLPGFLLLLFLPLQLLTPAAHSWPDFPSACLPPCPPSSGALHCTARQPAVSPHLLPRLCQTRQCEYRFCVLTTVVATQS